MKTLTLPKAAVARQAGFTIIELIVVILLLGILAATALPRFINVTTEAHEAAFDGVLGGFSTGMALGRAQWVANGQPAGAITNFGVGTAIANGTGVIVGTANAALDTGDCDDIFNVVLQGGRPALLNSTAATTGAGVDATAAAEVVAAIGDNSWGALDDVAESECEFYYGGAGTATGSVVPVFVLNAASGEITALTTTL